MPVLWTGSAIVVSRLLRHAKLARGLCVDRRGMRLHTNDGLVADCDRVGEAVE